MLCIDDCLDYCLPASSAMDAPMTIAPALDALWAAELTPPAAAPWVPRRCAGLCCLETSATLGNTRTTANCWARLSTMSEHPVAVSLRLRGALRLARLEDPVRVERLRVRYPGPARDPPDWLLDPVPRPFPHVGWCGRRERSDHSRARSSGPTGGAPAIRAGRV